MVTSELTTTVEVIKVLGGVKAVAALTNRTPGAAWNWTTFPTFPSDTYVAMQHELAKLGFSAPPHLWRMAVPAAVPPVAITALERAITKVGSPAALAQHLGITAQALSQWKQVPMLRVLQIERVTGVPRHELRPDLYPPADAPPVNAEPAP